MDAMNAIRNAIATALSWLANKIRPAAQPTTQGGGGHGEE